MASTLTLRTPDGDFVTYVPTTLNDQGLGEEALERAIESNLDLLDLDEAGVRFGAHVIVRQMSFRGPRGGTLRPDLVVLTDAGHVIVVEVKRAGNEELADRRALTQVIDYASGLSVLSDRQLAEALGGFSSLLDFVRTRFPKARKPDVLARDLAEAFRSSLRLIVACDNFPPGVESWLRGVANQSSLAFELSVLELQPFVAENGRGDVIFVPTTRARTEIISRTAVVVRNEVGSDRVVVDVRVESGDDIAESVSEHTEPAAGAAYPGSLALVEQRLGIPLCTLEAELMEFSERALGEDWSTAIEAIAWKDDYQYPYLRRQKRSGRYVDGRVGVDMGPWRPGIFVGVLVDPKDHKVAHSNPALGADFVAIVAVNRRNPTLTLATGDEFMRQPEFRRLVERLHRDAGGWSFHDHVAEVPRPNRWHPLHLRRPLATVLAGAATAEDRYGRWLTAARDAVAVLLSGGELRALRDRLAAEESELSGDNEAST